MLSIRGPLFNISNFQGHVLTDVDANQVESNVIRTNDEEIRSQTSLKVQFSISAGPAYMFCLVDNGEGSVTLRTQVHHTCSASWTTVKAQ